MAGRPTRRCSRPTPSSSSARSTARCATASQAPTAASEDELEALARARRNVQRAPRRQGGRQGDRGARQARQRRRPRLGLTTPRCGRPARRRPQSRDTRQLIGHARRPSVAPRARSPSHAPARPLRRAAARGALGSARAAATVQARGRRGPGAPPSRGRARWRLRRRPHVVHVAGRCAAPASTGCAPGSGSCGAAVERGGRPDGPSADRAGSTSRRSSVDGAQVVVPSARARARWRRRRPPGPRRPAGRGRRPRLRPSRSTRPPPSSSTRWTGSGRQRRRRSSPTAPRTAGSARCTTSTDPGHRAQADRRAEGEGDHVSAARVAWLVAELRARPRHLVLGALVAGLLAPRSRRRPP